MISFNFHIKIIAYFFVCFSFSFINFAVAESNSNKNIIACKTIDFSFKWNKRKKAAFATAINVEPNTTITSNCLHFTNIGNHSIFITTDNELLVSKNQQAFTKFPITISNNDSLTLRVKSTKNYKKNKFYSIGIEETNPAAKTKNTGRLFWNVQTKVKSRRPSIWLVGPNNQYKSIKAISPLIAPGDKILLEGNYTYDAVDIRGISGAQDSPIQLIGIAVDGKRPIITGKNSKYNWALSLRNSHYWNVSNLELKNAGICYRHESAYVNMEKMLMHHCGNGILGTDFNSGSLFLEHIEVSHSGGKEKKKNWKHGIYMSTDRDRFPNSVFSIKKSFLHSNKGNAIKSRAERVEIYNNWIENSESKQSIYALELIGYEEYEPLPVINHDVVGNVIVIKSKNHGIRVGGDNTGNSNGATRFSSNLFLFDNNYQKHIFRLNGKLQSLNITENIFIDRVKINTKINLVKDYIALNDWYYSTPHINIEDNYFSFDHTMYRSESHGVIKNFEDQFSKILIKRNHFIGSEMLNSFLNEKKISSYTFNFLEQIPSKKSNVPNPYFYKNYDNLDRHNRPIPETIPFYTF